MGTTTASIATTTSALASSTQTCTNPKPGKNGYLPPEACDDILLYVPSLAAAVLFCVLYGLTLICHGIQAFLYKKVHTSSSFEPSLQPTNNHLQRYAWVIMMGATWELIAFIFRALLTRQQNNSNYDTVYTIMFLLAPLCPSSPYPPSTLDHPLTNLRDQRLPLHDPRPTHLLLHPRPKTRRHHSPPLRPTLRLARHIRFPRATRRRSHHHPDRCTDQHDHVRRAYLHGWNRTTGTICPDLHRLDHPSPSKAHPPRAGRDIDSRRYGRHEHEHEQEQAYAMAVAILRDVHCIGDDHRTSYPIHLAGSRENN